MRAIPQLVSAPLNPLPIGGATQHVGTVTDNRYKVRKITQSKVKMLINELNVHVN